MSERLRLRGAVSVRDELARDRLVRRAHKIRAEAVLHKATIEYWNGAHPDEAPIDTSFEDSVIRWCDGEGPLPTMLE